MRLMRRCRTHVRPLDSDNNNITIEEGNHVFMAMVHLVDPYHFVYALSIVSRCLAQAFAKNSKPKDFHEVVSMALHTYTNVLNETAFDSLLECYKWDHAIELECEPLPRFHKVYLMTPTEQTDMDAFLEKALATGHI
jgi:hypothetical protein